MPQETKNKFIHLTIGTLLAIFLVILGGMSGVLSLGRTTGNYQAQIESVRTDVDLLKANTVDIPVLKEAVNTLKNDVAYTRNGIDEIKILLLKKN